VRALSDGFTERDCATQIVAEHLGALFPNVLRPTDFATFEHGAMVIRETTHRFSPYSTHRAMVGKPRPLLASALGHAVIAGANDAQRATVLEILHSSLAIADIAHGKVSEQVDYILADFARCRYDWLVGRTESKIGAIAVPALW
jgi:IclR family mhp operon transcriptional activator